ncbi:MAG TPA: phosphate/phosphite/phosphonate ABC transporter substrate-binding protein [Candidatus Thermoplasmatota archaeon]|nr:phosphate/phosphite/phosphonate ABC transporter substrate-binding protein [Candidatus Thermoplasmatota archaeon]
MRNTGFALLAALAAILAGCATPTSTVDTRTDPIMDASGAPLSKTTIVLAIQPTDNAATIQDKAAELEQYLEASMREKGFDADIQIYVPLSHMGTVEALRFGHADAAFLGSWQSSIAHARAGAEVVLAEKREVLIGTEPRVEPFYYSYYVVRKDSSYQTLEDVRGKTVAYASPTSGSGYVFPLAKLVQDGLIPAAADGKEADAKKFFGNVVFAGGYAQAWEALKNGQVDVAVTAGDINAQLYNTVLENTRIIAQQGPVPSHAVVFAKDFKDTPEAAAFQASLLELKGENRDLMRKFVSGIFVEFEPTTTADFVAGLTSALQVTGIRFSDKL